MSVWQTPQPATSIITSSGESSPGAVSVHSNWPLATNVSPLLVAGADHALCAGRAVIIGSFLTHNSNESFGKTMNQATLIRTIVRKNNKPRLPWSGDRGSDCNHIRL